MYKMLSVQPIESFQLDESSTQAHTTTFYDSHVVVSDIDMSTLHANRPSTYNLTDITKFLMVPRPVYDGLWSYSTPGRSKIKTISFPQALLASTQIACKCDHFKYFRADVRINVKVNASATHQGRLLISYSPRFNHRDVIPLAESSFTHHSALPHVQIDLGRSNNVSMLLPYSLPFEFMDLDGYSNVNATACEMGSISIWVMNQLRSDNNTAINFKVYANFENIYLSGTTGNTTRTYVSPVKDFPTINNIPSHTVVDYIFEGGHELPDGLILQMEPSSEASAKATKGVVSGVAESASKFLKPFQMLPVVGSYADAFAEGISAVGGVAAKLGYSNPPDIRSIMPVCDQAASSCHTSGVATGVNLTHDQGDLVNSASYLLTSVKQEMEISKIVSTPAWIKTFNITQNDIEGSALWTYWLSPINAGYDSTNKCIYNTPLSYISSAFSLWRGSLRFHFSFVTNAFSAARVRVVWVPVEHEPPTSAAMAAEFMSAVIDIVGPTEYSFTIPFCASYPWLQIPVSKYHISKCTYGRVAVILENALVSNLSTSLPIECNVWVSGAPDMQFSRLTDARLHEGVLHQSDTSVGAALSLHALRKAEYKPLAPATFYAEHSLCNPDNVTSIKECCTRLTTIYAGDILTSEDWYLTPFCSGNHDTDINPITYFAQMYRYFRGSFRVGINVFGNGGFLHLMNAQLPLTPTEEFSHFHVAGHAYFPRWKWMTGSQYFHSSGANRDNLQVQVPYYSEQYAHTIPAKHTQVLDQHTPGLAIMGMFSGTLISMGVGDDWEFINLIGAPTRTVSLDCYSLNVLGS